MGSAHGTWMPYFFDELVNEELIVISYSIHTFLNSTWKNLPVISILLWYVVLNLASSLLSNLIFFFCRALYMIVLQQERIN